MVRENSQDEITVSDGLQLGKTTTKSEIVDGMDLRQEVTTDKHVQLTSFANLNTHVCFARMMVDKTCTHKLLVFIFTKLNTHAHTARWHGTSASER